MEYYYIKHSLVAEKGIPFSCFENQNMMGLWIGKIVIERITV